MEEAAAPPDQEGGGEGPSHRLWQPGQLEALPLERVLQIWKIQVSSLVDVRCIPERVLRSSENINFKNNYRNEKIPGLLSSPIAVFPLMLNL